MQITDLITFRHRAQHIASYYTVQEKHSSTARRVTPEHQSISNVTMKQGMVDRDQMCLR
ncbi:hypothetical protein J6590_044503 [Homalodisca vitripennis]|nr:hypothetical protein J6590_044501 [Homalodisca vitripennis]KAG8311357.1 hypothetical protein J6590_044503 [Homalodisca vitripennis]